MNQVVSIPYTPRYPQNEIHRALEGKRFCVLVAHRRMGKTVCVINHLIKQALLCARADGFYAYVAPFRNQAKAIAWSYLKYFTNAVPGRQVNESELAIKLPTGATVRVFGADNPDALRGLYFDGVVLDEVAQMKVEVWSEIIRPALSDRMGFAVFIGTPKGINLFSELYYQALDAMHPREDIDPQLAGSENSHDRRQTTNPQLAGSENNHDRRQTANPQLAGWHAAMYRADETNVLPANELNDMRAQMGESAYRREMLCDFSASSDDVLISIDVVMGAARKTHQQSVVAVSPVVLGIDVARFGDDKSVIMRRQGLISFKPLVFNKLNNMELANRIIREINQHKPQAVFIDAGRGEGVIDRVRQLGYPVTEVNFGGRAGEPERYANKRSEMWASLAQWLGQGGVIYDDLALKAELSAPTYNYDSAGRLVLESKDKIKERLNKSPDIADALALTFAHPVALPELMAAWQQHACQDYNPMEYEL